LTPGSERPAASRLMVAGNWKMNTTVEEGVALARAVATTVSTAARVDVAVLPPFTHLWAVHAALQGSDVRLGAQDVYWKDSGAFTGEISAAMLAGWCDLTLVGHSERRHIFGERDDEVGRKFVASLAHGLGVILAVGETSDERDEGNTFDVVDRQLDAVFAELAGPPAVDAWVIAYEPVWAIGTGRTATPEQAQEVVAHIKQHVRSRFPDGSPRVLYGGSVTAANAASLFAQADIDGALVGGVSLRAEEFGVIVAAAEAAAGSRGAA
jgi:triosephosphate isomerase